MYLDLFDASHFRFNIPFVSKGLVFEESPHAIQKSRGNNRFFFWLSYNLVLLLTSFNIRSTEDCLWYQMPNISGEVSSYVSSG